MAGLHRLLWKFDLLLVANAAGVGDLGFRRSLDVPVEQLWNQSRTGGCARGPTLILMNPVMFGSGVALYSVCILGSDIVPSRSPVRNPRLRNSWSSSVPCCCAYAWIDSWSSAETGTRLSSRAMEQGAGLAGIRRSVLSFRIVLSKPKSVETRTPICLSSHIGHSGEMRRWVFAQR